MARRVSTPLAIVLEALLVAVMGAGLALAANQISSRGLALGRNYFPSGVAGTMAPARLNSSGAAPSTNSAAPANAVFEVDQRLKDKGLQPISPAEVMHLFRSDSYRDGQVVFVDARSEDEYRDGHIPGAWQLNPYHPERELGDVMTPCQAAAKVVVYCTGGECEDADSTAIVLRDAGVTASNLFVYGGGYDEWTAEHHPIERGARGSGDLLTPK